MDPLTQGALGAAVAQATPTKVKNVAVAGVLGFVSGMAADLDVFIRSSTDPLMFLEYHRHFTHALAFIPVGGFICALALYYTLGRRWQLSFFQIFVCCTLGYGTHALLDASTSYGTMLFWPFSEDRVSWSLVPVIDPLFTVPFVGLCLMSVLRKTRVFAWAALCWFFIYVSLGALQHHSAEAMAQQIAASRGHLPVRLEVKPSFANILVWKTIYEADDRFYVDAVRAGIAPHIYDGVSVSKLDLSQDLPWLDPDAQQTEDIRRFRDFSMGFVALDPEASNRVIDVRYSFLPNEIGPLWSLEVSPNADSNAHALYQTHRDNPQQNFKRLWQMLTKN
ncbi:MAG: metal-dependent hydrolase [Rhodospirillaceae bacterium]